MALGMQVGLGPGHIVLDEDPAPLVKRVGGGRARPPQFSTYFYCDQTAGYIKMPVGVEVGLSPGDCVRWEPAPQPTPLPKKKNGTPPNLPPAPLGELTALRRGPDL